MSENKNVKRRGIKLQTPKDARRVLRRVIDRAFAENAELESAGRIASLMHCWLKAWELERLSEIERRLRVLEEGSHK